MTILIRIITSSLIRRLLPSIIAAVLIVVFWDELVRALGYGVAFLMVIIAIILWAIWTRRMSPFIKWWNLWLGGIVFATAILGILGRYTREEGILSEVTLGGNWGNAISADQEPVGILIIIVLAVAGVVLIGPSITMRLLKKGKKEAVPASQKTVEGMQRAKEGLGEFYDRYPIHQIVIDWIKERRAPKRKERYIELLPPPSIPRQSPAVAEFTELPSTTDVVEEPVPVKEVPKPKQPPLPFTSIGGWQLPTTELLDEAVIVELNQVEIDRRARIIEDALASYGVEAKVTEINVGPAVTQFGVEPGWDRKFKELKEKDSNGNVTVRVDEVSKTRVKVERIASLSNDLALALAASSIRIEAPVPGKSIVGVEVPNSSMGTVSLKEVVEGANYQKLVSKTKLTLALGKGTASELLAGDLARMPHLLIAGATGSGKSVCLNSTIASLLMNCTPDDLKFVMIDPKRVELIAWTGIPHLMVPVVTESEKAVEILKWMVQEMENRYSKLAQVRAHNIDAYNRSNKVDKQMHYLVGVVDELADLMIAKGDEVEPLLCRVAQMGRAVGIHMIVATQRPSVDVITGLIKANFPTRISFAVTSLVDSRTILDTMGAEKLLGRGDMLYLPLDIAKPIRLQGCFASNEEIDRLVTFWRDQSYSHRVELHYEEGSDEDPILIEARRLAKEHKQLSVSFLQRQLRVGYSRALKLMQQIQEEGRGESPEEEEEEEGST
ncbi:DNA translocase FtsK [Chloroflexota bacterium]